MDQSMTLARVHAPALQIGESDAATSATQSTESSLLAMSAYKAFGPFRLFPARQLLLEDEAPVRLGTRGLEILAIGRAPRRAGRERRAHGPCLAQHRGRGEQSQGPCCGAT